jgi:hypothetical protein
MADQILTQSRLKELFHYDPDTGVVTRRIKVKHQLVGTIVGTPGTRGYLQCSVDGKVYKLHRLVWLYMYNCWPTDQIDHINHNTSDNRLSNLREVTCQQNHHNRSRITNSVSGFIGVTWHKRDKRWQAHIECDGDSYHLGSFSNLDAALAVRKGAEQLIHPSRPI